MATNQTDAFFTSALFKEVQLRRIFKDGKAFADASLKDGYPLESVLEKFSSLQTQAVPTEQLKAFCLKYFDLPTSDEKSYSDINTDTLLEYIQSAWKILTREDTCSTREISRIHLPYQYVVPGGRFRETYYWDSYFTIKGLIETGFGDIARDMLKNFIFLINRYGFIPNGARTYFLSRSQPPLFYLMLKAVTRSKPEDELFRKGVDALLKEYQFWMKGEKTLASNTAERRVVNVNGYILNRYWDVETTPRPESFAEDLELSKGLLDAEKKLLFRNLRAACESGWDFSSRWFKNPKNFQSICTTDIIPIDLNCLLYGAEAYLASSLLKLNRVERALEMRSRAEKRKVAIDSLLRCSVDNLYYDRYISSNKLNKTSHAGMLLPLFCKIVDPDKSTSLRDLVQNQLLKSGGIVTSLEESGQQWDSPNGWAPLQYFAYQGLKHYGYNELSTEIAKRFVETVSNDYNHYHVIKEKYNVTSPNSKAADGEYEMQLGFGWTNAVVAFFIKELANDS